jgi:hypothetical protein
MVPRIERDNAGTMRILRKKGGLMTRALAATILAFALLFSFGCAQQQSDSAGTEINCTSYSVDKCPSACTVCPPCEACSSISCNTVKFCEGIGFNRSWWADVNGNAANGTANANKNDENKTTQLPEKKPAVNLTIKGGSCVIIEKYNGSVVGVLRDMGAKYARIYEMNVSGTMKGPKGSRLFVTTSPTVGTAKPGELSCGGWEADQVMRTCTANVDTDVPLNWSYVTRAYGEQVNVAPNLQMEISGTLSVDYKEMDKKAVTVACPKVDY